MKRSRAVFNPEKGGAVKTCRPFVIAMLWGVGWTASAAGQRSLHGTVKDAHTGSPIAAAQVSVRGTRTWASTSSDGQFALGAPAGAVTLDVRRIGFVSAEVAVAADQNEVEIRLKATALELSEVIVTGQGTGISRRNLANNVESVRSDQLSVAHSQTVESALQGVVPGAVAAANGVIVISTKRGAPGPARFSITQRLGTNAASNTLGLRRFQLADAIQYDSACCKIDAATTTAWFQQTGGYQDYENQVYGDKSLSYETNLQISGGNENTQYFFSALNQHDNGTMYGTGYDKQGIRLNLTQLVGSKLQVRANTNLIHSLTKRGISNNDNVNITPYFVIGETPSFFDMRPVNGVYPFNPFTSGSGDNLLQTLAQFQAPEDVFRLIGAANATYTFVNGENHTLRASIDGGIDSYLMKANIYAPATLYWQQTSLPGLATDLTGNETVATLAGTLTHSYSPSSKAFTATTSVGMRSGYDYLRTTNNVTQDLLPGQQHVDRGASGSVFENRQRTRTQALFGQEELLLLNERLFVSGGVLAQKSTNNVDVNKFFYYPKAAASYRWPTLGPFEEFKVRVAYGQ